MFVIEVLSNTSKRNYGFQMRILQGTVELYKRYRFLEERMDIIGTTTDSRTYNTKLGTAEIDIC